MVGSLGRCPAEMGAIRSAERATCSVERAAAPRNEQPAPRYGTIRTAERATCSGVWAACSAERGLTPRNGPLAPRNGSSAPRSGSLVPRNGRNVALRGEPAPGVEWVPLFDMTKHQSAGGWRLRLWPTALGCTARGPRAVPCLFFAARDFRFCTYVMIA